MDSIVVDAANRPAGRVASSAAKNLLEGKTVLIVNAGLAIVSGNPRYSIGVFSGKVKRGDPYHGPFYPRQPDRILRRIVRGMLPKKARGREALRRLRVFSDMPEGFKGIDMKPRANAPAYKHITLKRLSRSVGGTA